MKKIVSILLVIVMCLAISSCTMSESLVIGTNGKVTIIVKTSLSEAEANSIKENAKNNVGKKVDFGDGEEVLDAETAAMAIEMVDSFIAEGKTETVDGEKFYYTEEEETMSLAEYNKTMKASQQCEITATDYWAYSKDANMNALVTGDGELTDTYGGYLKAFGTGFEFVVTMKMPYKIVKTNIAQVDDYTVNLLEVNDSKVAYVITEKSTADWTKAADTKAEILKLAKKQITSTKVSNVKVNFVSTSRAEVSWENGYSFDKIEVQYKAKGGKWTTKTVSVGKSTLTIKKLKANKKYYFKVRGFVENADFGKVYGAAKTVSVSTAVFNAPSVKLTAKSKAFTVSAKKKYTGINGYEIKYSTKKSLKGAKTKSPKKLPLKIKKLKSGTTYYVKVRKYVKNDYGKKIYGTWTKVKKVTVK